MSLVNITRNSIVFITTTLVSIWLFGAVHQPVKNETPVQVVLSRQNRLLNEKSRNN